MTLLEKAKEIIKAEGKNVSENGIIEYSCPSDYELEEAKNCVREGIKSCEECWNRKMPNTEPRPHFENPVIEKAYNTGLEDGRNEVWELIDKLSHAIIKSVLVEVFGYSYVEDIIDHFTPQEALAKLKAYEEAQKIEVGDVVEMPNGIKCVVTVVREDVKGNDIADGFTYVGYAFYDFPLCDLKKTGKHIDISSILEQIGE